MKPFIYQQANSFPTAQNLHKSNAASQFIAGGTNLLDLMKKHIALPDTLIDITKIDSGDIKKTKDGISIGALATNAAIANHEMILKDYPLVSKAILKGASPQIRNMATTAGNMLQRTRCPYFYDLALPCNKRAAGSGCGAKGGLNKMSAIFGASDSCVAVHPSDMCIALVALDATVTYLNANGKTVTIPFQDFHRLPGNDATLDNNLPKGAIIQQVGIPKNNFNKNYHYLKIRDRTSYAFALVSVAAALDIDNGVIKDARLASGGVAHKPWRFKEVEKFLIGKRPTEAIFKEAGALATRGAKPLQHNTFKVKMLENGMVLALKNAIKMDG